MSNRQIAKLRGISLDAVKYHVANAIAKAGVADRRGLRQWFRAPGDSALNVEDNAVDSTLQLGPIGQVSRSVRNIREAEEWYGKVLGLRHLYTFGKLAFFKDPEGRALALMSQVKP